ncbi:MAG TPA: AAA family ATPase [Gammaproteobacteria bacterium]|nr:AAA family ATPase [Gammaproteobacteria bacterium]
MPRLSAVGISGIHAGEDVNEKLAESLAGPIPEGTPRRLYGTTRLSGKVTAVIGVRRSGKTTLLHQLRRDRLGHGAKRDQLPYMNFEDERLADLDASQLGFLLDEYGRQVPGAGEKSTVTWCFDEIHSRLGTIRAAAARLQDS